jgi:membrane associated rhomboid family serine protease
VFPLRDHNPTELTPVFTVVLIATNVAAWLYIQGAGVEAPLAASVCRYGLVPGVLTGEVEAGAAIRLTPRLVCEVGEIGWTAALTSMFMHGGWLHLIGNMWFLWLFGNNIEDSTGRIRFLLFYLLCGLAGSAAHVWATAGTDAAYIPTVGASGAISGVMGAYLVLYPRVRIDTLFVIFIIVKVIPIPAWLILLQWIGLQLLYGSMDTGAGGGGVAFWAHIGGFVAGVLLVKPFENRLLVNARKRRIKLDAADVPNRGWW